ncbi:DUF4303 domain-containing protein [Actinomadura darangshiensis]|uniref:DUF4303 domain-containing protein n=1 Tax=Actinomadura darangshiensis TaxID=705336 RepID=A0A4R5BZA2_9ACTN|nr:DUF4303 domain-containing protein [Actinomadura darangshiensis]TDD92588.1 DUF4303 domain-containing protein [Actinomadura darangshiensis]
MSFDELATRLADSARVAFTQARRLHPGESFYCYALYTDAFAAYILPTCASEEGLCQIAKRYAEKSGRTVDEHAASLRWGPADSPYHLLGEEHFAGVLGLLESRDLPWQHADDAVDVEVDGRFDACFRALAALEQEGFFGHGAERDRVVVNVLQGDQSDESVLENARRLNPPAAVAQLERDLHVSS